MVDRQFNVARMVAETRRQRLGLAHPCIDANYRQPSIRISIETQGIVTPSGIVTSVSSSSLKPYAR